jgi:nucleotide-binding universal stress UspA family protein
MRNILIPTDLTYCTLNTMKYAINLCLKSATKMLFYHSSAAKPAEDAIQTKEMISTAFKDLGYFVDDSWYEIIVEEKAFSNKSIKNIIDSYDIDLVIMGVSHKVHGLTFFESHVSELINEVACPVLSVPHDYDSLEIDRIGYATELYDISDRLKEIVPFARLLSANIEAFHVYPVFPQVVDIVNFKTKEILSQLSKDSQYDKINIHFIKTKHVNEPVKGIYEFLRTYKPDMLVMCHKPKGLLDKLLIDTGTTNEMVKISQIPIMALNQRTACKIM